jgi:hypothetical protein
MRPCTGVRLRQFSPGAYDTYSLLLRVKCDLSISLALIDARSAVIEELLQQRRNLFIVQ